MAASGVAWACGSGPLCSPECNSPCRTVWAGGEGPSEVASLQSWKGRQPCSHHASAPGAQSKSSQVHGKPACKAAWRFPRHAPRCEGEINLNNYCPYLAWPYPSANLPWKRAGLLVPRPALPGLLQGAAPSLQRNPPTLPSSAAPRGFSPPVHEVNEVGRAIQCALAETDKLEPLLELLCWY